MEINEVFEGVKEYQKFWAVNTGVETDYSIRGVLPSGNQNLRITLDFGSFIITEWGMGDVTIEAEDQTVIDVFNAAQTDPVVTDRSSTNELPSDARECLYDRNQSILEDVINEWIEQSDHVTIDII